MGRRRPQKVLGHKGPDCKCPVDSSTADRTVQCFENVRVEGEKVKVLFESEVQRNFKQLYESFATDRYVKKESVAHAKRLEGNEQFAKQLYQEALELYSQATIWAPFECSSNELSIGFANRSAALFKLNRFKEALEDIAFARTFGYPSAKMDKLYKRRKLCEDAIKSVETPKPSNESNCSQSSSSLFGFSNAVRLFAVDSSKNRGLEAARTISAGELISSEKPYAAILSPDKYFNYCYNCLIRLPVSRPFPCQRCIQVVFCSKSCADSSWDTFHKFECTFVDLAHVCDNFHFPPKIALRTVLSTPRTVLMETIRTSPSASIGLDRSELNYQAVHSLVTHSLDCPDYSLPAALILSFLCEQSFINESNQEELIKISALILRHIQQCQVNAIRISDLGSEIGCGLYQNFSLINHSCRPNALVEFKGSSLLIRAKETIKAGEEVFVSYGTDHQTHSKPWRQEFLRKNYFFQCACEACAS